MPLLPLEPFIYPDDLFTQPPDKADPLAWWVLHTRPRAEKALARKLLQAQSHFFLPLHKRQWRNKGRLHQSYLPLFPGYIFLKGQREGIFESLTTNQIVRVLEVPDQRQLRDDLSRVYYLIAAGAPLAPEERLQPGAAVEITGGPLAGLEGKVLRRGKQLKFYVEVQFLQQGVSVEIESWMIQPRSSSE